MSCFPWKINFTTLKSSGKGLTGVFGLTTLSGGFSKAFAVSEDFAFSFFPESKNKIQDENKPH